MRWVGLWLAEGAVTWNPWQAGLAAIRERYLVSDPEASPPEGVAYSTWSQKLWSDLSEEVLGPEWRKMLKQGRVTPRLPQSGAPRSDPGTVGSGLAAVRMLPPTSKAGGTPVPSSSWKSGIWGLLEKGTKALSDMEARKEAREEARSAPGKLLRGPPPPESSIFTPRVTRAKTTSELGRESPTQSQLGPGCAITSELYSMLETNDIDVDEISSVAIEKLNAMGLELRGAGYAETRSDALIQLEWFIRDLNAKWRKEAAETGQRRT